MKILVVDDEKDIRLMLKKILTDMDYQVVEAADEKEAMVKSDKERPDIVLLDIWLKNEKQAGLKILAALHEKNPLIPVLMISGHGTIETAVAAMKQGAYDFIEKPFKTDELLVKLKRAGEVIKLRRENKVFAEEQHKEVDWVGSSPKMTAVREMVKKVAKTQARVLITGPSGSGKKRVAAVIHALSKRVDKPVIMAESSVDDLGKVYKRAEGGTLVLNEVFDCPKIGQDILLKSIRDRAEDPRILSLSSKSPEEEMGKELFRQDLYYRLNVVRIDLPALRDHIEDVEDLARFFLKRKGKIFTKEAERALKAYPWPGNIRQFRNVMEWLHIMKVSFPVKEGDLPAEIVDKSPRIIKEKGDNIYKLPLKKARRLFEEEYLKAQWSAQNGNISKMAEKIGMERTALHRKLKDLGIK